MPDERMDPIPQKENGSYSPIKKRSGVSAICEPDCEICGGIGWVSQDLPVSDPQFGKLKICPNGNLYNYYGEKLGLDPEELSLEWSGIREDVNGVDLGVKAVQEVMDLGYGWVFIWGDVGLAKTLILKTAIADNVRKRKLSGYVRMVDLIDELRSVYDTDHPSSLATEKIDYFSGIPLLAIDEVDRVRDTEFTQERRFLLLDRRYEDAIRKRSITLLASNSDPSKYPEYLSSRIFDGRFHVVKLSGDDVRPAMWWEDK